MNTVDEVIRAMEKKSHDLRTHQSLVLAQVIARRITGKPDPSQMDCTNIERMADGIEELMRNNGF